MEYLYFALIGLIAGFFAAILIRGESFGWFVNLLVGIGGALLGGWLFDFLGWSFAGGLLGQLLTALLGSIILLILVGILRKF